MLNLNFYKSKRKRKEFKKNLNFLYKSKDLNYLFLKEFDSLTQKERNQIIQYYNSKNKLEIFEALKSNKIIPFGAYILSQLDCDRDYWQPKYDFFFERNLKIKDLLDLIFKKLDAFACKSIALTENFGVLLSTNSNIGCFSSGDIDLSANIFERDKIIECLNHFGFYSKDKLNVIGEYSGQSMQFFNKNFLDEGFWINVIWKPVTRAFLVQDNYESRLDKERINFKLVENTRIRVLNDTALMYFCCLHISAGHYFTLTPGLRLYYDIDRLASHGDINWNNLKLWESEDKAGLRISFVLILSKKILNSKIPIDIFESPLNKLRNRKFLNYLFDGNNFTIQSESSLLRRLFVELRSDDKNIIINFFNRFIKYFFSKININLNFY